MNKICAGIVTFNPDPVLFQKCFDAISSQVERVYIFDNGSRNADYLHEKFQSNACTVISFSPMNVGIAKALNELCKMAESDAYSWIVTMDQDSICDEHMVASLAAYRKLPNIGILAPRVEFRSDGHLIASTKPQTEDVLEISACITSGSLTNLGAWRAIGGFDEWMFIDHVDNDFCTNLVLHGYKICRVGAAVLYQRAGEMKHISLPGGKKLMLPYYSEFRNYYICRNTVYYLRKYGHKINFVHEFGVFVYSQLVKLIFENIDIAYEHGDNIHARRNMLHASFYAGCAFTKSYVGYVHAVAHSLGGQYNVPHGLANAILLPLVLREYGSCIDKKLHRLAIAAGTCRQKYAGP